MTGARQVVRERERNRSEAVRQVTRELADEAEGHGEGPPADELTPKVNAGEWRLRTVWIRTPSGASIPTSYGALPSRIDVFNRTDVRVTIQGSRVIIERETRQIPQRIDLPNELCVLEYDRAAES